MGAIHVDTCCPNSRWVALPVARAVSEFMNDFMGGTIVVRRAGSEPVLGFIALQSTHGTASLGSYPTNSEARRETDQ